MAKRLGINMMSNNITSVWSKKKQVLLSTYRIRMGLHMAHNNFTAQLSRLTLQERASLPVSLFSILFRRKYDGF